MLAARIWIAQRQLCNDFLSNLSKLRCKIPLMTLDEVSKCLSRVTGVPVREFSTYGFGRERNLNARSVIVPQADSRNLLKAVRHELDRKAAAFIGTTRWLGCEKHPGAVELAAGEANSQLDALRIAQSDAVNYGLETEDLIRKLTDYDRDYGIDIFHAETDTIGFSLDELPRHMPAFCKDLYEFCPDIVDQGVGTVEALEKEIRRTREVFLGGIDASRVRSETPLRSIPYGRT